MPKNTFVSFATGPYAEELPEWAQKNLRITAMHDPEMRVMLVAKTDSISDEYKSFAKDLPNLEVVTCKDFIQELGHNAIKDENKALAVFKLNQCQKELDLDKVKELNPKNNTNKYAMEKDILQYCTVAAWNKDDNISVFDLDQAVTKPIDFERSFKSINDATVTDCGPDIAISIKDKFSQGVSVKVGSQVQKDQCEQFVKDIDASMKAVSSMKLPPLSMNSMEIGIPPKMRDEILVDNFIKENGLDGNIDKKLTTSIPKTALSKHCDPEEFIKKVKNLDPKAGKIMTKVADDMKDAHPIYIDSIQATGQYFDKYVAKNDEVISQREMYSTRNIPDKRRLQGISFNETRKQYEAINQSPAYEETKQAQHPTLGQQEIVEAHDAAKARRDYGINVNIGHQVLTRLLL